MFKRISKMAKSIKNSVKSVTKRVKSVTGRVKSYVKRKATQAADFAKSVYYRLFNKTTVEIRRVCVGTAAEAYVDTGVKILIAVVIGALLLGLLYALFNDTIMPSVTEKVEELFEYAG